MLVLYLDKIAYLRVAQRQRRYSSGLVCTYFYNVSDTNYATFPQNSEYIFQIQRDLSPTTPRSNMLAPSTWTKSPILASLNLNDATAQGQFPHVSTTYLTQIMQHFHRTQSIFSTFSETFPLPGPHRICWPPQLGQNRLSPRRSTLTTLQLRASFHIFL